jgi:hypothetical protein
MAIEYGNQTLGRGELRFSRFKTGTYTPEGFRYLGNSPSFSLTVASTNLDHYSSDHGVREKDKSIAVEVNRTAKFDADDIQLDNLAYFFFGSKATVTQTSSTANTETFTGVIQGLSYQIGLSALRPAGVKGISNVVVKIGTTTKVAGTDYVIDLDRGILIILTGGSIATGADVIVTYDTVAKSYDQIISGHTPVTGALMFIADNPEGANIDYLIRYCKLTPNGDFQLKADNAWQSLPFNVEILRAPGLEAIYANGQPYSAS